MGNRLILGRACICLDSEFGDSRAFNEPLRDFEIPQITGEAND